MLVVQNLVVELARRVFQGQRQELRFVEDFGEFLSRVSQGDQVGEADPGLMHCLDALGKLALLFPHRQGVPDRVRVHVAVETDPIGGGVEALIVPLLTLGKLRRVARELELQAIDEVAQAGEEEALVDSLGNHLEHADSLSNLCLTVQLIYVNSNSTTRFSRTPKAPRSPFIVFLPTT